MSIRAFQIAANRYLHISQSLNDGIWSPQLYNEETYYLFQ